MDPTQPNPPKTEKYRPNPTQPNPTHGSTQPMDNSGSDATTFQVVTAKAVDKTHHRAQTDRSYLSGRRRSIPVCPQRHFNRFSRFWRAQGRDQHRHMQTDHATPSVAIGRMCTKHAMRPKARNVNVLATWAFIGRQTEDLALI